MKFYCFSLLFVASILSCKISHTDINLTPDHSNDVKINSIVDDTKAKNKYDSALFIFSDSLNVAQKNHFKLSVVGYKCDSSSEILLDIILFEKMKRQWTSIQNIKDTIDYIYDPEIEFIDINNDGSKEFSFKSSLGGRGFNVMRRYYFFDKKKNKLVCIKNSSSYPNLSYNKVLGCVESSIATGGSATIFLQLEADSLREFASIELFDSKRIVKKINKTGVVTIIDEIFYNLDNDNSDMTYGDYDYLQLKKYKNQ